VKGITYLNFKDYWKNCVSDLIAGFTFGNQSVWHSNTINFNGIIGNRILWKLRLKFHLCIGISNFTSMVSNSGYSIESVSLLIYLVSVPSGIERNTADAVFCQLITIAKMMGIRQLLSN
jgi:hypothetical protein